MLSEKGLCKILKQTYKQGGYEIMPVAMADDGAGRWRRSEITINGAAWAVRCQTVDLPKKATVQIVEDAGYLPVEPMKIRKGEPNQMMLEELAAQRQSALSGCEEDGVAMMRIPVIFKDRWQLYQTDDGQVFAFDTELLQLVDFEQYKPQCWMLNGGALGLFEGMDCAVYIAPGRFSAADAEKICHIAALDWENQQSGGDPAVNVSLFDADEDVPLMGRDEE